MRCGGDPRPWDLDGWHFDYLAPSVALAVDMLGEMGREAWAPRVTTIVELHHRIRPIPGDPLAEAFRRADLCDLTFGRLRPGFPPGAGASCDASFRLPGFISGSSC